MNSYLFFSNSRAAGGRWLLSSLFILFLLLTLQPLASHADPQQGEGFNKLFDDGQFSASARVLKRKFRALARKLGLTDAEFESLYTSHHNSNNKGQTSYASAASVAASGKALRLEVDADGLYQVNASSIAVATGMSWRAARYAIRRGQLALSSQGQTVPWEAARRGKAIRFIGEAPAENPYTTTNVYWLELGRGEKIEQLRTTGAHAIDAQVITAQVRLEENNSALTVANFNPDGDYWRWKSMRGGASWNSVTGEVELANVVTAATASLSVDLQSIENGNNRILVYVNDTLMPGSIEWPGVNVKYSGIINIPADILQEGTNTIKVEAQAPTSDISIVYLDGMTLTFERNAVAVGGVLQTTAPADGVLSLDGFDNRTVAVYELGQSPYRLQRVRWDQGLLGQRATFTGTPGALYLAVEKGAETVIEPIAVEIPVYNPSEIVDYLVIADRSMQISATAFADYRAGSGLNTRVVLVDEIDNFVNHGVSSPYNIRDFITMAERDWGVQYAVLAGIACHDYRNLTGLCTNLVSTMLMPTPYGMFACDSCLGDTDGDTLPNVHIGRIPASDDAQLAGYLSKLANYDNNPSINGRQLFMVADYNDPDAGFFKQDTLHIQQQLATDAPGVSVETLLLNDTDLASARALFLERLTVDRLWSNYIGHGGGLNLSKSGLLFGSDAATITGGSGVLSTMTCAAAFHDSPYFSSLAEQLVLDSDGGPAVMYAPSGLSLNDQAVQLNRTLLDEVFALNNPIIGDAVASSLQRSPSLDIWLRQIYQMIGDPYLSTP